jgi:hypothetical protein
MLDLSRLVDSDLREMVGQLTATLQDLLNTPARPQAPGIADFNEELGRRLWDLGEVLDICAGALRGKLTVNDGDPGGLFRHYSDTVGMELWTMVTAINDVGDAVGQVAYRLTRAMEEADPERLEKRLMKYE